MQRLTEGVGLSTHVRGTSFMSTIAQAAPRVARLEASVFRRLEDATRRGVSAGFSRADDSAACAHLQPGDFSTSAPGVATRFEFFRAAWNSCFARRKRSRSAELLA